MSYINLLVSNIEISFLFMFVFLIICSYFYNKDKYKENKIIYFIFSIIVVIFLLLLTTFAFKYISYVFIYLKKFFSTLDAVIIVTIMTALLTFLSSLIFKFLDYRQSKTRYLIGKREISYSKFIEIIYMKKSNIKLNIDYARDEAINNLYEISGDIILWGSKNVVDKYTSYLKQLLIKKTDDYQVLYDLINDMRKDLGIEKISGGILFSADIDKTENSVLSENTVLSKDNN